MARTPKLSDEIVGKIKFMIHNNLKPDDKLPTENELSEQFGVSRTTIRESLKVLVSQGVLINKKGGKYVSNSAYNCCDSMFHTMLSMDICSMSDILQVRNLLEVDVVGIVVNNLSDATIQELERIVWELQNPDLSNNEFSAVEIRFHNVLARETNNKLLMDLLAAIREITARIYDGNLPKYDKAAIIDNRIKLLEALKARNRSKAMTLAQEHIEKSRIFFGVTPYIYTPLESGEAQMRSDLDAV